MDWRTGIYGAKERLETATVEERLDLAAEAVAVEQALPPETARWVLRQARLRLHRALAVAAARHDRDRARENVPSA